MAIPFLNNITLNNNEIQNVRLQNGGNPPLNSGPGQIYFNTGDTLAKYYSNITDEFVSLKEYSFPTDTYITGAVTGTTPKPIITFDLNAVDGTGAPVGERYLSKNNKWETISSIPGTYYWEIEGDSGGPQTVASGDVITFEGGTNVSTVLVGTTLTINSTDQFQGTVTSITAGVGLSGGVITTSGTITLDYNGSSNYILANPNGSDTADAYSKINFHNDDDEDVYYTELGEIPVSALTLVKNYIDSSVSGGVYYQGGYNPSTDTTSPGGYGLQTPPNPNIIEIGWMYTVTADGTFFGEQLRVGDVLIAEIDAPTSLSDWTTVQNNIDFATAGTDTGAGAAVVGISRYDEDDFTVSSTGFVQLEPTSKTGTITAGNLSGTVTHDFGINTIVQTISSSGDTVFCDVTRTATTSVATISVAEATDITILVQKIG
jgi:hypothetical protein